MGLANDGQIAGPENSKYSLNPVAKFNINCLQVFLCLYSYLVWSPHSRRTRIIHICFICFILHIF